MRTRTGLDTLSFDDLYNNLRVFESDVKGSGGSSSSTHNVAFVGSECTTSTNEVSTGYGSSTSSGQHTHKESSSSYVDEVMHSFFANQSNAIEVSYEDLTQVDKHDLEEMDLKWQMAMLSMRVNKFYKKTRMRLKFNAKEPAGFDKSKVECFKCHKIGHFARECRSKGTQDSKRRDARYNAYKAKEGGKKQAEPKALAAVDVWSDAPIIDEYESDNDDDYEIRPSKEQVTPSYAFVQKDKSGLGFDGQITESDLFNFDMNDSSVFDNRSSDLDDIPLYDRFKKAEGNHAVPPPLTGIYMPPRSVFGLDESNFSYGPKQSNTSESEPKTSKFDSCESNSSVESLESMPKPVVSEPKVLIEPRVWSDAPIIEEYESDSDDDYEIRPSKEQVTPSYAFVNTSKHVKTPREPVNVNNTYSQSPKVDKRDWNGRMSKTLGLGYSFTKKACFVCGSLGHLIRDCTFHEEKIAKHIKLNKMKGKGTGPREERPVWNNVQRTNHQNKFVPQSVLTKSGRFPINTGRHNFTSQPASIRSVRKVNTGRPKVNETRPKSYFYKSHSPFIRPFNNTIALKTTFTKQKVNTAGVNSVSVVGENRETAVKASTGCNWRSKRHYWNKFSKYNDGSMENPPSNLEDEGIVDSRCSRHMIGNKEHLDEYQDIKGSLLVMKIDSLEKELKETKQTFGHAVIKLVERVKSLEVALKRKSRKVILSESEASMNESAADFITPSKVSASGEAQEKDISPTTMEAARTLSQVASEGVSTYKRRRRSSDTGSDVNTDLDFFSTAKERIKTTELNTGSSPVKSGGAEISTDKGQREGKAQMTEEDIQATEKKRLQLEQERAGLEEAARLQAQMDAEVAKQIHMDKMVAKRMQEEEELSEQQKKRRDEVQEAAKYYSEEDWNTIRAKLEASAALTKILQGKNVSENDFAKKMVDMINQKKKYYAEQKSKAREDKPHGHKHARRLHDNHLSRIRMRSNERMCLRRTEEKIKRPGIELEQESSKKQKTVGSKEVPVIQENVEEPVIVKRKKLQSHEYEKEKEQLSLYLTIASDEDKEVDYEILDQKSPIIEVIIAPCYCNEALTSPVQTATGKDTSNLLMADDHKDKECSHEEIGYNPQKLNQKKLEVN
ncbi:putative ribonuclease H-like domain-containing protein, partial [Tanacetum coccineum]